MAEAFELYYIPQQTRRDKLRTLAGDLQACAGLDLYDPSPFLSCANLLPSQHTKQTQTTSLMAAASTNTNNGSNNELLDLQPVRDEDNRHCSFIYTHQDLRLIHGGEAVVYTPETLALSLSSHNSHAGDPPLGLRFPVACGGGRGGELGRSTVVTLGPYTGYASVLKGSKFLKPAQEVLDEICEVGFGIYAEKFGVDCGLMMDDPPLMESLRTSVDDSSYGGGDKSKKSRLISLLDEVYKRYKQYYQQIQAVIASFEAVTGLSHAVPFVNLDLKAMSKHFRCLNNAIMDQLHFSNKPQERHISYAKEELLYGQHVGYVDHQPVWRPQRGLPKRAVTVLRAWLFDHFLHPYPTDADKQLLAKQTGLSRNQVSNWFINARVRLWKPMVEEVHTLETRQVHTVSSHIHHQVQDPPSKRTKHDNNQNFMEQNKEQMNFYNNFSIENRGVSLTLGLHQNINNNKAMMLAEAIPLNGAGNDSFVMGGFLHDFGG